MDAAEHNPFVYEFGKFVLDPGQKTLTSDGIPVHLPAKEFDTLLLLLENNGRALSKEEMMSSIWRDAIVEEGNLAKQISRLRKLLNSNGEEYIETLPKHGYRFSADLTKRFVPSDTPIMEKRTVRRVTYAVEDETDPQWKALRAAERTFFTWRRIALIAVLAAMISAAVFFLFQRDRNADTKIDSVAVLPLQAINPDEDTKELGLGLTDALITKLGSLKQVVVRPTTAVASFSSPNNSVEAGRKLNVDAVLEGTIQEADGRLRVNARLVRTDTGEQIWTEKFEQPTAGIFALQDALSTSIAKALAFELNKADSDQLLHRGTTNAEAYEKYLRGRFYQSQNTPEGFNRSIEFYQQAIALDPNFAEAYAGVGDANLLKFNFGVAKAQEVIPEAREAVQKALNLNPDLSNAYTSLSLIRFLIDGNWPEAERGLQRALELDPNNADAYNRYGYFLMRLGRFDEALEKLSKAREINPLGSIIQSNIGLTYLCAKRYAEAIEQLERTAAENPRFPLALWLLQTAYEAAGYHEKAFASGLRALEIEGGAEFAARLRSVKEAEGLDAANRLWFDETVKARAGGRVTPLTIAMQAATIKDREQTLYWIERSAEEGDTTLAGIRFLSKFDFVRDDPRFQAVMEKVPF
jgi:DNA-binding winged helix-turn-helix (wHTH) protein/TolB-like protein